MSSSSNKIASVPASQQISQANSQSQRRSEHPGTLVIGTCAHREFFPFSRWAYCVSSPIVSYSTLITNDYDPEITFWHRNDLTISLAAISFTVDLLWADITESAPTYDKVSCVEIHTNSVAAIARLWPGVRSYKNEHCLPPAVKQEIQNQNLTARGYILGKNNRPSDLIARRIERKLDLLKKGGVKVDVLFATQGETIQDAYAGAAEEARDGVFVVEMYEKLKKFGGRSAAKYEGLKYKCRRKMLQSRELCVGAKRACVLYISPWGRPSSVYLPAHNWGDGDQK
ncbi:hypothetical protein ONS95_010632 [Cadophora gregata]|uniref:uncharacterized protein n=1 Tax=Cadophora gregata TaxID=51156 RepID=UPI0026DC5F4E|nr:uncharacterized protein ONS95_010632 [Cadophora gregata]KAK0122392.1 hypothetical protein ONS95_010632 [Cadophora gregata]